MARMFLLNETEDDQGELSGALVKIYGDGERPDGAFWIGADEAEVLVHMLADTFDVEID